MKVFAVAITIGVVVFFTFLSYVSYMDRRYDAGRRVRCRADASRVYVATYPPPATGDHDAYLRELREVMRTVCG